MHAAAAEDVGDPIGPPRAFGRQSRDHEVRRAAAEIDDEREFLAVERLLVGERRGDGFELRLDLAKAFAPCDRYISLSAWRSAASSSSTKRTGRPSTTLSRP